MKTCFVEAGPFWRWFLNRYGLAGIVMPNGRCYYLPPWHKSPEFVRHEKVHLEQMKRLGRVQFTVLYLYYLARYGYRNNPMEIEAYGHEKSKANAEEASPRRQRQRPCAQGQG